MHVICAHSTVASNKWAIILMLMVFRQQQVSQTLSHACMHAYIEMPLNRI